MSERGAHLTATYRVNTHERPANSPGRSELSPLLPNSSAPLANTEMDEGPDGREVVSTPFPGVDDGFFTVTDAEGNNGTDVARIDPNHPRSGDPDVEVIPVRPRDPEPIEPVDEIPETTPRFGGDGGSRGSSRPDESVPGKHDEDGVNASRPGSPGLLFPRVPKFPYAPGFGTDLEVGSTFPGEIPDVNIYQHKKTLAQGMMDLALFSANANQLRYVLESSNSNIHPYYIPSIILISFSLILQVAIGIGLVWNATYNVKHDKEICIANKINNFTIIGIFLVTVINVFISAFGVANAPT